MSYSYHKERQEVFTEHGQVMFLRIRDGVKKALAETGALTVETAMDFAGGGSTFTMLACIDRLKELGEIEILQRNGQLSQYNVIVAANPAQEYDDD